MACHRPSSRAGPAACSEHEDCNQRSACWCRPSPGGRHRASGSLACDPDRASARRRGRGCGPRPRALRSRSPLLEFESVLAHGQIADERIDAGARAAARRRVGYMAVSLHARSQRSSDGLDLVRFDLAPPSPGAVRLSSCTVHRQQQSGRTAGALEESRARPCSHSRLLSELRRSGDRESPAPRRIPGR